VVLFARARETEKSDDEHQPHAITMSRVTGYVDHGKTLRCAMLRALSIAATFLAAGCPSHGPASYPTAVDATAMRIRIARAEVKRAGGVAELEKLVATGTPATQMLALRGLGRIGGDTALAVIKAHLGDADAAVSTAAFAAIGVAASLDDTAPLAGEVELPARMTPDNAVVVLEAFGRAGAIADQPGIIAAAAGQPPKVVAAAALALGRMARRKLAYQNATRAWLVERAGDRGSEVRYAAAYALSREHQPGTNPAIVGALVKLVSDDDPETRATAIAGLAKRDMTTARVAISESLRDRDWRVAVEAVRALAGDKGDAAGRDLVATNLERRFHQLEAGHGGEAQVLAESLRQLIAHPDLTPTGAPALGTALIAIGGLVRPPPQVSPLAGDWLVELAVVAGLEGGHRLTTEMFAHGRLPEYLRIALAADAYPHGDATFQREALRMMLEHPDARVRAAGIGVLPKVPAPDRPLAVTTIAAALASPDPILAGAASDAAGALYELLGDDPSSRAQLDGAIVERAAREPDPELSAGLFELIGKHAIASGADACRAGLAGHPVRARAAATCLKALGQAVPVPPIGDETPPPVDVAAVIGKHLTWHVVTTAGELVIELRPDIAPWNVATIVALTQRHFYDGLAFHRVVPDFVVQGGDPTSSGYGGPGFTTPAEPASALDGPGFVAGGIGIADAGRDSGGSQWFAMHSRAPHLDGRYTYIGALRSGQKSADSLLIGDTIQSATIVVEP
jgi:cyclophilin family peptidyl-prolyl cis-trans isomerase/HEAT repeat protein